MNQIGLELNDEHGYALAELVAHLHQPQVKPYAKDRRELLAMCEGLTGLQLALEHAGLYPRSTGADIDEAELRRLWGVLTSPYARMLLCVLGDVQKDGHSDWMAFVNDVMRAMDMLDAGVFPDDWRDDDQGEIEAG